MAQSTKLMKYEHHINGSGIEEDKLSSLPEELLVGILSNLQLQIAASTSALSHHWRYLWTKTTSIVLLHNQHVPLLPNTINNILQQLITSPKIRSLELYADRLNKNVCKSIVNLLIHRIKGRKIEQIKIVHDVGDFSIDIPGWFLDSPYLVKLEIVGPFMNPSYDHKLFSPNLPNLRKLKLMLTDDAKPLLGMLFKSCPLLEDLYLDLVMYDDSNLVVVDISCPNLKHLHIDMKVPWRTCKFLIDAPRLLKLWIRDSYSLYHFVEIPISLVEAYIEVRHSEEEEELNVDEATSMLFELFKAVSSVNYLRLSIWIQVFSQLNVKFGGILPNFANLLRLIVDVDTPETWKEMLLHLKRFPNIEVLEVDFTGLPSTIPDEWTEMRNSLCKLKEIKLYYCGVDNCDEDLLMIILSEALFRNYCPMRGYI